MSNMRVVYELALADFRERTRRYSFLLTMLGVLFFGYLVITGQYTVQFGDLRPVYDSVWAGSLMAVCGSIMLALAGFYLIRGAIQRDRLTRVGEIIAATPLGRWVYLTAKLVSNTLVLWLIVAVLALVSFLTLLFRNETAHVDLWSFIAPFLIIALPAMIFVAALAVLFDTVKWLQGSLGNIIYLFAAEACLILGMLKVSWLDLAAIAEFTNSAKAAAAIMYPDEKIGLLIGFIKFDPAIQGLKLRTFPWDGITWTATSLLTRASWLAASLAIMSIAVLSFNRFDPATAGRLKSRRRVKRAPTAAPEQETQETALPHYGDIQPVSARFSLRSMVSAELRLALKGYHWFWYAVAIGLAVAQLAAPFEVARQFLVPGAMIWPLVIWSSMGTRERRHDTGELIFSSPDPMGRQFPALWIAGCAVALAAVGPMLLRALAAGAFPYAATLLVAAFLVPSVSLALGTSSGSRKLFEVLYLFTWYVGSIDRLTPLDLLGTTEASISGFKGSILVLLAVTALIFAFTARRVQVLRAH